MKKSDIKVGMKVRIREWDDMLKIYPFKNGYINCPESQYVFNSEMKRLCGKSFLVASIKDYFLTLSNFDGSEVDFKWRIDAWMVRPIGYWMVDHEKILNILKTREIKETFEMPPPPDCGELNGVKLPAWFWNNFDNKPVYVFSYGKHSVTFCELGNVWGSNTIHIEKIEPYTGQDKVEKVDVDELKRRAYLC